MEDQIPFLFSTGNSQAFELCLLTRCAPLLCLPSRHALGCARRSSFPSTADISNPNLPALRLLRNRRPIETRCSVVYHRLHRAFCMFLLRIAVQSGLAETHSSVPTKIPHRSTSPPLLPPPPLF